MNNGSILSNDLIKIIFRMVQAPSDFDLVDALEKLRSSIDTDLEKGAKPNEFISAFQKIAGPETDKKSASDQTLKVLTFLLFRVYSSRSELLTYTHL